MKKLAKIIYIIIFIVTLLLLINFLIKEKKPSVKTEIITETTAPSSSIKPFSPTKQVIKKDEQGVNIQETKKTAPEPEQTVIAPIYKIEPAYPEQHFFEGEVCKSGAKREAYQSQLQSAIQRLGSRYQHTEYQLSDYITLNLYGVNLEDTFKDKISERILKMHNIYIAMLGHSARQSINFNLVITPNRTEYLSRINYFSSNIKPSLGVYFGGLNLAYVDYQGAENKALKTATHESIHVINSHLLGRTSHALNEGMAELYEDMTITDNGTISLATTNKMIDQETLLLMEFFDNQQWEYLDISQLYYSSWAWIAFMNSNRERVSALIHLLKKEQEDPCSALSAEEMYQSFQSNYSIFESEFYEWQNEKITK